MFNLPSIPNRAAGTSSDSLVPSTTFKGTTGVAVTHEFEAAVVVDVILDETHPEIKKTKLDIIRTPLQADGVIHQEEDVDLSYIGRVLIRPIRTFRSADRETLKWALPLDAGDEYPLLNEIVSVVNYMGSWYYTKKINLRNRVNNNVDFGVELDTGDGFPDGIRDPKNPSIAYMGPKSSTGSDSKNKRMNGVVGRYFKINNRIRRLKRFEGDTMIESRFGSSIRFGTYDNNPNWYSGDPTYADYKDQGGNPMILIRNRQRPIVSQQFDVMSNEDNVYDSDLNPSGIRSNETNGEEFEEDFNSYIHESINWDGSSIHITSGQTISKWKPKLHFRKLHFQSNGGALGEDQTVASGFREEQPAYSPSKASKFRYPILNQDQIVMHSDRIIISARNNEIFQYAKKRLQLVTDQEFCVDAHEQMVFTTNEKVVINSPHIYLGEYNQTREPAMLGQTSIEWLYDLCEWLHTHTHWYHHSHPDAGAESPSNTQQRVEEPSLNALQNRLPTLLSKRVFMTGGGYAPGADGQDIERLDNTRVGRINNTPGGYYVAKPGAFRGAGGRIVSGTTNGLVEPEAGGAQAPPPPPPQGPQRLGSPGSRGRFGG
jgi:hypothetical protein